MVGNAHRADREVNQMHTWRNRGNGRSPGRTWLGRLLCRLRLDRNPLRRGSDRAETAMLCVLLAAFLAGAPFAAHAAGAWTQATSAREAQAQQSASHPVEATVLQAAPWNTEGYSSEVSARWEAPDGRPCTGQILVPTSTPAGSSLMIWVSQAGRLTSPPLQRSQVTDRTELAEGLAVAAVAVVLIVAGLVGRWSLDRRRLAGWDAEWLAAGPRWSSGGKTPASGD
jgi:hypothetical protein